MSYLIERLLELEKHLDHLRQLSPRVSGAAELRRDLTLHNDVLFSLIIVCQLVIDLAGELSSSRRLGFEDYTGAIRNLATFDEFPDPVVKELERLPGFRNVVLHEYVAVDLDRVVEALQRLEPVAEFATAVRRIAEKEGWAGGD